MTDDEKTAFHAAGQIRDRLWKLSQENLTVRLPTDYWQEITRLARRIEIAASRGWSYAAQSLCEDLARSVDYCRDRLTELYTELEKESPKLPSLAHLYHELLALYEEFEEVEIDFTEHEIVATTESITLEGIFLGPFEIRLDWEKLGTPSPYRINAIHPNPASANEGVTHPHVQDERLCEGEGRVAIQHALEEGRLGDFFLLVAQVLRTYGKGSAFIELDDWEGGSYCSDCGESTYESDHCYCSRCDATLCDTCARSCCECESTFCSDCLESCAICDDGFCSSCLTACKNCHKNVCQNCLTNNLCEKCNAQLNAPDGDELVGEENDSDQSDAEIGETQTQAEPLAVGV